MRILAAPSTHLTLNLQLHDLRGYGDAVSSASNTTGQITSAVTTPYTTPSFPVPSITSFQATTGSSVLLTTNESSEYYWGMNVYGCPGAGCTNFVYLGNYIDSVDGPSTVPPAPAILTGLVGGFTPATTYTVYVTALTG